MNRQEARYTIALREIKDIGPVLIKRILTHFASAEDVFHTEEEELLSIGLSSELIKRIKDFKLWDKIDNIINTCEKRQIEIYTIKDERYPKILREISDPPPVLFCRGEIKEEDNLSLAIVGSRKYTEYGKRVTERLAYELASLGITIVSGLARGVDSIAHNSTLSAGGRTIAFLGSGVSVIYPPENKKLVEKILKNGAILSEFYPEEPPRRENFPKRNRLISGVSLGTIVTEATLNSGALITAFFALEQGREVFAVPGNINSKNSEGTNLLIKRGAKLVQSVEDILEEIKAYVPLLKEYEKEKNIKEVVDLNDMEKAIFNLLHSPLLLDELVMKTGMNIAKVLETLLQLEIKGLVEKFEGKYVRRNI